MTQRPDSSRCPPYRARRSTHGIRRAAFGVTLLTAALLSACSGKSNLSPLDEGKASVARKDYRTAVVQFKSVLEQNPQSREARELLGESLLGSGDPSGAAVELAKALEQGADANKFTPLHASALLRAGDLKRLTQVYANPQLSDKDANALVLVTVAAAWAGLSDPAKAAATRAQAAALAPDSVAVLLMRAQELAGKQQYKQALALIDQLLAAKPATAEAWSFKGDLLVAGLQDAAGAEQAYRKALEVDKTQVSAHFALINQFLRKGDLKAAKAQAAEMKQATPTHPLATYLDAQIAFNSGEYDKARDIAQALLRAAPNNLGVLLLSGSVALQSRDLVQAETHFAKALQIDPSLGSARLGLAHVYLDLNQPERALASLQPLLASPSGELAEALTLAGSAELARNDAAAAEALFAKANQAAPGNSQVQTSLALAHLARGAADSAFAELAAVAASSGGIVAEQAAFAARMNRREYEAALQLVDQIAKKQPDSPLQHELRGRVYVAQRDYAKARKAFEDQSKADPKNFGPISSLAKLDLVDKKPADARKRLQDAIKADPKNPYALMLLAQVRTAEAAPVDEVKQVLAKAVEVAPQLPEPRLQLIALTLRKRLYKEALVAAQEAMAAMPNDINVLDAVGRAQMEAGDVEQSIKTFRKMAGAQSQSGLAYTRLSDIYKATGRRDLAESSLRKALEVEPGMPSAQAALVDLLIGSNRKTDALDYVKQIQRDKPNDPVGYSLEAAYHLRNKATDEAVAAYRKGLAKTGSPQLAQGLHRVYVRAGRFDDSERFDAEWLKDHPKDVTLGYLAAETDILRNRFSQAQGRLQQLLADHPDNVLILNNLANVLLRQAKPGALPHALKAANLAPDNSDVADTLAAAQAFEKQFDAALATQKRAVELSPKNDALRLHLADIALKAGDKALAKTELTRLKEMGAQFKQQEEVTRLLKLL